MLLNRRLLMLTPRDPFDTRTSGILLFSIRFTQLTAVDPKRSDNSPNSGLSRVIERTLTALPFAPGTDTPQAGNPARPN